MIRNLKLKFELYVILVSQLCLSLTEEETDRYEIFLQKALKHELNCEILFQNYFYLPVSVLYIILLVILI